MVVKIAFNQLAHTSRSIELNGEFKKELIFSLSFLAPK